MATESAAYQTLMVDNPYGVGEFWFQDVPRFATVRLRKKPGPSALGKRTQESRGMTLTPEPPKPQMVPQKQKGRQ